MKKNGFTLIELLGVISILAIIAIIIIPSVDYVVKTGKDKAYKAQVNSIELAIDDYYTENKYKIDTDKDISVSLEDLKNDGYLDFNFRNPINNKCFSNQNSFLIKKEGKKETFVINKLIEGEESDCGKFDISPSLILFGKNYIKLDIGENYIEPGFKSFTNDGQNLSNNIIIKGDVDIYKVGKYDLIYQVVHNDLTSTRKRTIEVIDTEKPTILGLEPVELLTTDARFDVLKNIVLVDNSNENVNIKTKTNLILGVEGSYYIDYIATDKYMNVTKKTREVVIKENYNIKSTDSSFFNIENGVILNYSSNGPKDVIIPHEVNNVPITGIGNNAFNNKDIKSIILPKNITSIGDYAFSQNNLKEIVIPEKCVTIGIGAFMNNNIENLLIPDLVTTIGSGAFSNNKLSSIGFQNSIESIGQGAFNNCLLPSHQSFIYERNSEGNINKNKIISYGGKQKENIVIPKDVTTIGEISFMGCGIKSVEFHNNVSSINYGAFMDNEIVNVIIPSSIMSIGESGFNDNPLDLIYMPGRTSNPFGTNWYNSNPTITLG